MQLRAARIPFVREYHFAKPRRWRFDFAIKPKQLAIEVDGGLFVQGRHSRGTGVERDMEKANEAALLGWRVLRVSPRHIRTGVALSWIERAMQ